MSRNTVARIDLSALRHNLARVREMAPQSQVACVVKADAYGHGIRIISRALDGADLLAVATVGEVGAVRSNGWRGRLLLLEGFSGPAELNEVNMHSAEFVLHHRAQIELLEQRGEHLHRPVWLKIDTGMHRLGFSPEELPEILERLRSITDGQAPILMSHFARSDEPDEAMTALQIEKFDALVADLPGQQSLANSAAVLNFPQSHRDYIRPGIMLYGISPMAETQGRDHGLKPVMTLGCQILAINHCRAGDQIGYGARYTCPRDMRVAVAGIGYGDGYPRSVPDGTPVLVNGRRACLAGRVSMDLVTIDLSGHDDARVGDPVTLWGEGLPVEEVARAAGAIAYELVCGVTGRVKREAV